MSVMPKTKHTKKEFLKDDHIHHKVPSKKTPHKNISPHEYRKTP